MKRGKQALGLRRAGKRNNARWARIANLEISECRDCGITPLIFEQRQAGSPVKPGDGRTGLGEKLGEKLGETRSRIVALMSEYPRIAITDLANRIGITTTAVENQIALLKRQGIVKRVGPAKGGHWEVGK